MDVLPLVNLAELQPHIEIDLRYATANNLTGFPIYQEKLCLLHTDAARSFTKAVEVAALANVRLVVLDAYRPQMAQKILWATLPDARYVRSVTDGSHHSRGVAIDVTLRDLNSGKIMEMGTHFDEMGEPAHPFYVDLPPEIQRNRLLLNAIMFAGGFQGIDSEWWHFELPNSTSYPLLDDQFPCSGVHPLYHSISQ